MKNPATLLLSLGFVAACKQGPDDAVILRGNEQEEEQIQNTELGSELLDLLPEQPAEALESGQGPYVIGENIEPPQRLGDPGPIEGLVAMMQSGEYAWGVCLFQVTISETGEVGDVVFLKPEHLAPEVEQVIDEGVQEWKFSPATMDGEPVSVYYNLLIHHCPYQRRGSAD